MSTIALVVALVVAGLPPTAAGARQVEPGGATGYNGPNVWAGYLLVPVAVASATTGGRFVPTHFCVRLPLPNPEVPGSGGPWTAEATLAYARSVTLSFDPGAWHTLICYRAGEELPYLTTLREWDPRDPTGGAIATPETVALYAERLVATPGPQLATSPPLDSLVVGLETWFASTGAPPPSATAQAGPMWATAVAVPEHMTIEVGDRDHRLSCVLPASPPRWVTDPTEVDDSPNCLRYVFTEVPRATGTRRLTISSTITYRIELTDNDHPSPIVVDRVDGTTTDSDAVVREIQTVLR